MENPYQLPEETFIFDYLDVVLNIEIVWNSFAKEREIGWTPDSVNLASPFQLSANSYVVDPLTYFHHVNDGAENPLVRVEGKILSRQL